MYVKGNNIKKTIVHLQKANDIGGTNSTPPLATTRLPVSYTHLTLPTNREV